MGQHVPRTFRLHLMMEHQPKNYGNVSAVQTSTQVLLLCKDLENGWSDTEYMQRYFGFLSG